MATQYYFAQGEHVAMYSDQLIGTAYTGGTSRKLAFLWRSFEVCSMIRALAAQDDPRKIVTEYRDDAVGVYTAREFMLGIVCDRYEELGVDPTLAAY